MASVAPEISALARDEAFESLYRRYVKDVYHYALALLRNPADAEDVTQTTFMNAYRAYRRGDQIEKPQNWLIKIAHNVARTRYARSSRRVKEVPLEDHVDQLAVPEDERPSAVSSHPPLASTAVPDVQVSPAVVVRRVGKAGIASHVRAASHEVDRGGPSVTGGSLGSPVTADLSRSAPAPALPTSPTSPTEPIDQTVDTVVTTISATVPALPVQVPALPPLPVQPPPPPGLP